MGQFIDMTGWKMKEHGVLDSRITVIEKNTQKYHPVEWWCLCECGKKFSARGTSIRSGETKSCGCYQKDIVRLQGLKNQKNLQGQKFGLLTVLEDTGLRDNRKTIWRCKCDCGQEKLITSDALLNEGIHSCGCARASGGEIKIKQILEANKIDFLYNSGYFKDLYRANPANKLRYDFIIFENHIPVRIIEFDGPQHEQPLECFGGIKSFEDTKLRDKMKDEYAQKHNIPLVRIPYKERDNITLDLIMGDKYLIS